MKRFLITLLLIFSLLTTFVFTSCDINTPDYGTHQDGTDNGNKEEPDKPEEPGKPDDPEDPEKPEHTHYWIDATCTEPQTCECGQTRGKALGHNWIDADCTDAKRCSVCEITEGEPLGHNWIDADCTNAKYCSVCEIAEGEPIGHSYSEGSCTLCGEEDPDYTPEQPEDPEKPDEPEHTHVWSDATCTLPQKCECGETNGSPLGHDWIDADCTNAKYCSVCKITEGSPLGHNWIDADCTNAKYCSVCNTTEGSPLGHNWIDADCTNAKYCSVCNTTEGSPLGHDWIDADCTNAKYCFVCKITVGIPLGHSYSEGSCTICGEEDPDYVKPEQPHVHTDGNADNTCDGCGVSVIVVIDFYVLNDLHGKFCDTETQPGVDELASYLKDRENYDDNVILMSSGDMWQGSSESNLTSGMIITEWMNELGFVSMTLGNHEYDWGEDAIRDNLAAAEFPFLAINIYNTKTGKLADYCTPSVVVECDGIQVGIIGAISDCYSSISSDMVADVEFKVGSELTALVKAEATRLREEGVDLIIYSIHGGYGSSNSYAGSISSSSLASYYDVSLSNGYIDLCFESHSHQKYVYYDQYNVYHLQGGGENYGISHVELSLNYVTGNKMVSEAEIVRSSVYSTYEDDPATEAIEEKYADIIEQAYATLGKVSVNQSSSVIEDIVSELYLEVGLERWGDRYDIVLGGGYINTRSPYDLAAGEATYSDVLSLLPFDNQLVLCSISGSKLKSQFINTTNSNYHNTYSDYGNSIKNSISSYSTYYVVVDTYTAYYSPNGLTIVDFYDEGVYARDLLAEEIRSGRFDLSGDASYSLTSIPEIIRIGESLDTNGKTAENYYVKGTVKSKPNSTYGNLTLVDEDGNELWI